MFGSIDKGMSSAVRGEVFLWVHSKDGKAEAESRPQVNRSKPVTC